MQRCLVRRGGGIRERDGQQCPFLRCPLSWSQSGERRGQGRPGVLLARLVPGGGGWGQGLRGQELSLCQGRMRDHCQDSALAASPLCPQHP